MDLTLDYNVELFPLQKEQSFALALASSLARGGPGATGPGAEGADDSDDKDRDVWRPDGKGRRGLEEDYDYVMYGKVSLLAFYLW
jgi:DNA-directed RNA polymerase I, II, and III subunit RPABC3